MLAAQPDIILVTADSLRVDRIGSFGGKAQLTPRIDEIANQSFLFRQTYSDGPNTPHAFPAIMTGRSALAFNKLGLFETALTLAEALQADGYSTCGFNAGNPYVSRHFRYDRGFDQFTDYIDFDIALNDGNQMATPHVSIPVADIEHYALTDETIARKMALERVFTTDVTGAIAELSQRPVFLWVHCMDSHYPYTPDPRFQHLVGLQIEGEEILHLNQRVRENGTMTAALLNKTSMLYDAAVAQLDASIGAIVTALQQKGLFDNALFVFCADHGEEFLEHGDLQHKSKMYDELLHVPLLIKLPGQTRPVWKYSSVNLRRLPASIMSIINSRHQFPGHSLVSSAGPEFVTAEACYGNEGGPPTDQQMFETAIMPKRACLREKQWKLIFDTQDNRQSLYNLLLDIGEKHNIISENPEVADRLTGHLTERLNLLESYRLGLRMNRFVKAFL